MVGQDPTSNLGDKGYVIFKTQVCLLSSALRDASDLPNWRDRLPNGVLNMVTTSRLFLQLPLLSLYFLYTVLSFFLFIFQGELSSMLKVNPRLLCMLGNSSEF